MERPIKISAPAAAGDEREQEQKRAAGSATPPGSTHVSWDEETIAKHDLERGTRMKIDEPNTPYHYYSGSDMEAADGRDRGDVSPARSLSGKEGQAPIEWNELETKLLDVQGAKKSEWDSSDDEDAASASSASGRLFAERDAEGRKIQHDPKFAEKRKMHYNEFERVRAWKMQHAEEDDDDEDDEDDGDDAQASGKAEGKAVTSTVPSNAPGK